MLHRLTDAGGLREGRKSAEEHSSQQDDRSLDPETSPPRPDSLGFVRMMNNSGQHRIKGVFSGKTLPTV